MSIPATSTAPDDGAAPIQDQNQDTVEHVRRTIYRHFAASGGAPRRTELAAELELTDKAVDAAFEQLARARHLVLDADGAIVLAHPFATRNFGFSVMGARTLWWGGCAWDAFAIPHLVEGGAVLVATNCPACADPLAWNVTREAPPTGPGVAHFLVPVNRIWDDVVHACNNQRIFCDVDCVETWRAQESQDHAKETEEGSRAAGSVFSLETLWRLAERWYEGRLDSPYRRREPQQARDYFRDVGLVGEFWGN